MRALEFIRDHVTFKLPYNQATKWKPPNTVSGVFEDLKFKISEDSDQNWSCPDSALLAVSV